MNVSRRLPVLSLASALALCAPPARAQAAGAPFPHALPWGWTVQSDLLAPEASLGALGQKLGAAVVGVRNTVFEVGGGKTVQVNVLVAGSAEGAAAIRAALLGRKAEEAVVQHGVVVFELVGPNTVWPEIQAASRALRATPLPVRP